MNQRKKTIKLTDKEARVATVENALGVITVGLEWGGPGDRMITDFDLSKLGNVSSCGTNGSSGRSGWVTLDGAVLLAVGDTVPAVEPGP